MKNWLTLFLAVLTLTAFGQQPPAYAPDQLIIKFKESTPFQASDLSFQVDQLDQLNEKEGLNSIQSFARPKVQKKGAERWNRIFLLHFDEEKDIEQTVEVYRQTDLFEYVEPNYTGIVGGQAMELNLLPNDTWFARQWGLVNDGTFALDNATPDSDIDMDEAWDIEQGDASVIAAVLDNGMNYNHPEFDGRIWSNSGEIANNGVDDDNNGYVDDVLGWDFAYEDNDPNDAYGHGTNVGGIMAATGNNGLGYAGVDWNCTVMPIKILNDDDFGFYSWWAEAIQYAVDNGAKTMNMSVGGSSFSALMEDAVNYAYDNDVVVVACMMNFNTSSPYYPAGYAKTIAVGSTDADDTRTEPFFWSPTSGSNFGNHLDVVAPGNYIYGLHYQNNNNYNSYWGGTSQASPVVTGLVSLLFAQNPNLTFDEVRTLLHSTSEDQVGDPNEDTPGPDNFYGHGRVNAFQLLSENVTRVASQQLPSKDLTVFPNPFSQKEGGLSLSIDENLNEEVKWRLMDLSGKQIDAGTNRLENGRMEVSINTKLPTGAYLIELNHNSFRAQAKVIVR
jgi:thermitase